MIKEAIEIVGRREDLAPEQMREVFYEIMSGRASHEDMRSFLVLLTQKVATIDEITEAAAVMRDKMTKIYLPFETVLDTCGTGGGASSFNVSTIVSIVAASAGARVAKHGNRSYTSHCGSADILEHVGVKIDIPPERTAECIKEVGVGFMFAPLYHSAMKHVSCVRKEIKQRTIFNILGPLSNPAGANTQLIGTFDPALTEVMARCLGNLGSRRAFVAHGADGFDEISISGETIISEFKDGAVSTYRIKPEDLGLKRAKKGAVACKTLGDNIDTLKSIFDGKKSPRRDMVLMNAAFALTAAGIAASPEEGVGIAAEAIDWGKAKSVLDDLVKFTNG